MEPNGTISCGKEFDLSKMIRSNDRRGGFKQHMTWVYVVGVNKNWEEIVINGVVLINQAQLLYLEKNPDIHDLF